MFKRKYRKPYKHLILEDLEKDHRVTNLESAEQVLDHLLGDGGSATKYHLKEYVQPKANPVQRLNLLWVWPLYALTVAPVMWVITGDTGLKAESRAYGVLMWLIGRD